MTTQELKKQNREKWMMSHGITTTDYMDELIDLVWNEAYNLGYKKGKSYRDAIEGSIPQSMIDQQVVLAEAEAYKKGYIDGGIAEIEAEPFYTKDNNGVIRITK